MRNPHVFGFMTHKRYRSFQERFTSHSYDLDVDINAFYKSETVKYDKCDVT